MAKSTESIAEFYKHKFADLSENLKSDIGQFNVFRIEEQIRARTTSPTFIRRDFFKIMLFLVRIMNKAPFLLLFYAPPNALLS